MEILNERDRTVLARGRALLEELPSSANGDWHGDLSPLRLIEGTRSLEPGTYVMRFESSGESVAPCACGTTSASKCDATAPPSAVRNPGEWVPIAAPRGRASRPSW